MKNKINSEILSRINKGIESVRPFLNADGGDVKLVDVTPDNVVKVKLTGACDGCPFSVMTLKTGIEQAIRKEWPEMTSLESV